MIKFEHISKKFGSLEVLKDVTQQVDQNEIVSLIGPSGSGKSTLLRCMNLLEIPSSGRILFKGEDITAKGVNINIHRQKMGMVFQHFNVFPNMTVENNITMAPVLLKKMDKDTAHKKAMELLDRVGLKDKADVKPVKLSGGQKQRLTIARALVRKPAILVFDDSSSALDFATEAKLRKSLQELSYSPTIFIVSQRTSSIQHADNILVLDDGELAGQGTHDELVKNCEVYREIYNSQA